MSDEKKMCPNCMAIEALAEKLCEDLEELLQRYEEELTESKPRAKLAVVRPIHEKLCCHHLPVGEHCQTCDDDERGCQEFHRRQDDED